MFEIGDIVYPFFSHNLVNWGTVVDINRVLVEDETEMQITIQKSKNNKEGEHDCQTIIRK